MGTPESSAMKPSAVFFIRHRRLLILFGTKISVIFKLRPRLPSTSPSIPVYPRLLVPVYYENLKWIVRQG